jgi:hypothetical protein
MTDNNVALSTLREARGGLNPSKTNGHLQLMTRRGDAIARNGRVYHYTQAMIHTKGKFSHKYGYFELFGIVPTVSLTQVCQQVLMVGFGRLFERGERVNGT